MPTTTKHKLKIVKHLCDFCDNKEAVSKILDFKTRKWKRYCETCKDKEIKRLKENVLTDLEFELMMLENE